MKQDKQPSFKWLSGIIMVFIYLSVAVLLIFTPIFEHVSLIGRIGMGALFFVYGLFRAYRAWKTF